MRKTIRKIINFITDPLFIIIAIGLIAALYIRFSPYGETKILGIYSSEYSYDTYTVVYSVNGDIINYDIGRSHFTIADENKIIYKPYLWNYPVHIYLTSEEYVKLFGISNYIINTEIE